MHITQFTKQVAVLIITLLFGFPLVAQINDFREDRLFFLEQKQNYQTWLDKTGLGKTLYVYDLKIDSNHLALYLAFPSENLDTVVNAWEQLKWTAELNQVLTLEEQLFFRMESFMGLRQEDIHIEIYDTYDWSKKALFFRGIYYDKGQIQVEKSANPRNQIRTFSLQQAEASGLKKDASSYLAGSATKNEVFQNILNFAMEKYRVSPCDSRRPKVMPKPNEDILRFEVSDLCREVLKEEENPIICSWLNRLGYTCNWTTRELLTFSFHFTPSIDGFTITLILSGKVGSGYYEDVKRKGYMDMELEFKEELEEYADEIILELKNFLKRP